MQKKSWCNKLSSQLTSGLILFDVHEMSCVAIDVVLLLFLKNKQHKPCFQSNACGCLAAAVLHLQLACQKHGGEQCFHHGLLSFNS